MKCSALDLCNLVNLTVSKRSEKWLTGFQLCVIQEGGFQITWLVFHEKLENGAKKTLTKFRIICVPLTPRLGGEE